MCGCEVTRPQLNQKYCRDSRAACCSIEMWRVAKSGHGRIQSDQRVQLATRKKTQFHFLQREKVHFLADARAVIIGMIV
jgi:hypothetical protein